MLSAEADPRGLIAESYRLPDLSEGECRSIFLDWALGLPADADVPALAARLAARAEAPGHPMTAILEAAAGEAVPRRRGGPRRRRDGPSS